MKVMNEFQSLVASGKLNNDFIFTFFPVILMANSFAP